MPPIYGLKQPENDEYFIGMKLWIDKESAKKVTFNRIGSFSSTAVEGFYTVINSKPLPHSNNPNDISHQNFHKT